MSIASPFMQPSPNGRRVGIRIVTFEACSSFTYVTAHRIAQSPKATFVTRLQPCRLPNRAARQLPDQSTILRVESSSTDDSRLRGARPISDTETSNDSWRFKSRTDWRKATAFTRSPPKQSAPTRPALRSESAVSLPCSGNTKAIASAIGPIPMPRQSIGATPKLCAAPPITETLPASMNLVRRGNQGDF